MVFFYRVFQDLLAKLLGQTVDLLFKFLVVLARNIRARAFKLCRTVAVAAVRVLKALNWRLLFLERLLKLLKHRNLFIVVSFVLDARDLEVGEFFLHLHLFEKRLDELFVRVVIDIAVVCRIDGGIQRLGFF